MPEGGLPYAGTPEMDELVQQIQQDPSSMSTIAQNPALLAEVLKHMGIPVEEEQLLEVADDWINQAADKASGAADGEQTADTAAGDDSEAVSPDSAASPAPPTDEAEDAEQSEAMEAQAQASPAEMATAQGSIGSTRMQSSGGGGRVPPIDDLISAQMMQGAAGNPNTPVPQVTGAKNFTKMKTPGIPRSQSSPSSSPDMKNMIANLYRQISSQSNSRAGIPRGASTGAAPASRRSRNSYV